VREWSFLRRNGRRLLSKKDVAVAGSDTARDVWEPPGDVKLMPPVRAKVFGRIRLATAIVLGCALAACGGRQGAMPKPKPTLASSRRAQDAFRPLLKRWASGSKTERIALGPELDAFQTRFPDDGLTPLAGALSAWVALERGDLERAGRLARSAEDRGAGTSRDIAALVDGAAQRRRGRPVEALATLSPLAGKLIDPFARSFLSEEIAAAALSARRWSEALQAMRLWLRESSEEERAAVASRIAELLPTVPGPELVAFLDRDKGNEVEGAPEGDKKLRELVALRLARLARERGDPRLAQRLLGSAGSLLGEEGTAVAALASGATAARVDAQTIGLVLSVRGAEARRRGSELAAGLAYGMGLPGSPARLVIRDDGGQLDGIHAALSDLSAEGAAILVASIDPDEAPLVVRFADQNRMPVVLVQPWEGPETASRHVFFLGEDPKQALGVIGAHLGGNSTHLVVVGSTTQTDAHTTGFAARVSCADVPPVAEWRENGVRGVVLLEGPGCAERVVAAATTSGLTMTYAVGPGASGVRVPSGSLTLTAGLYPIDASTTNSAIRGWVQARGSAPSWWAGLGHDAGVLAWAGVRVLPTQGTEDAAEVRARRATVRATLAAASGELWTTEARGFAGGQVVPRKLGVRTTR